MEIFSKRSSIHIGTPIDPDPRLKAQKKSPPVLIRFNHSRTITNYSTDPNIIYSLDPVYKTNEIKQLIDTLPPIRNNKNFKMRHIRYISPVFNFNAKKLRPLFENKKKVDQSLNTKMDFSDSEIENCANESQYKITVTTKNTLRKNN